MIGKLTQYGSYLALSVGLCCALYAVGIVFIRGYRPWSRTSRIPAASSTAYRRIAGWISGWRTRGSVRAPGLATVVLLSVIGIFVAAITASPGPALDVTAYNVYFPKVTQLMDADDYMMQDLDSRSKSYGQVKKWHFCKDGTKHDELGNEMKDKDGKPIPESVPFDEGEMLLDLTYRDYGVCVKALSWHFQRDPLNKYYETRN